MLHIDKPVLKEKAAEREKELLDRQEREKATLHSQSQHNTNGGASSLPSQRGKNAGARNPATGAAQTISSQRSHQEGDLV